jgi:hypothetical protein
VAKSFDYPIRVGHRVYFIDVTYDGYPAIYQLRGENVASCHVDGKQAGPFVERLTGLDTQLFAVARAGPQDKLNELEDGVFVLGDRRLVVLALLDKTGRQQYSSKDGLFGISAKLSFEQVSVVVFKHDATAGVVDNVSAFD